MKRMLPRTCGTRRTGRSRRHGQLHSPTVTSAFSKIVITTGPDTGHRETGNTSTMTPESARRAREEPMRIHPRRSPGTSRARDSDRAAPTPKRSPMITVAIDRILAPSLSANSAPVAATKRPENATGTRIDRGSTCAGVPMTRIVAPRRAAAAGLTGSAARSRRTFRGPAEPCRSPFGRG